MPNAVLLDELADEVLFKLVHAWAFLGGREIVCPLHTLRPKPVARFTVATPIMHIEVVQRIPDQHAGRLAILLKGCFGASAAARSDHADRFCSQADAWRHVLAIQEDVLVGCATIYRRSIMWQGKNVALGGLGDVCTDPGFRHQGVATAMVRQAMAELEGIGDELAYLCAAVNDPGIVRLYGQVGFVPLGRPYTYDGRSGRKYTDDDAMVAPVGSTEVFDEVMHSGETLHLGRGNW